jgi:tripartite-type tricarboxylate transporter receptor subunit TctC
MKLIFTLLLATLSTFSSAAFAQDYPNRPIKLIVPFPPAGGTDNVARLFVQEVSQRLGQTVVIENRAGPLLNPKTPYSPVKSFTPIIYLVHSPSIMIVPLSSKATTVSEFIALAKANPGKLNYGSAGIGGIPHLSGERFQALSGTKMTHVPYKGTALAVPDLLAGRLDVIFDSFSSGYPHVRDGKARALGVSSAERSPLVPNLPAISEQLPGFVSLTWFGVLGPAGLPAPIVDKVNAAFSAALNNPKIREQLAGMGIDAVGGTPAEFVKRMADDTAAWSKVIADAKITLD